MEIMSIDRNRLYHYNKDNKDSSRTWQILEKSVQQGLKLAMVY